MPAGFAGGLRAFDHRLPELYAALRQDDCLTVTADHGCDPLSTGTEHTREYVPILIFSPGLAGGVNIGTRSSLADMGQTVAANFGLSIDAGESSLKGLK